jgi:hypothetical protein
MRAGLLQVGEYPLAIRRRGRELGLGRQLDPSGDGGDGGGEHLIGLGVAH